MAFEKGIDLWIGHKDGIREGQQCKARNASQESWDYGSIHARGIIENWKFQLMRNPTDTVSLISPLVFTLLEDLTGMVRNTSGSPKDFLEFQIRNSGTKTQQFFKG